MRAVEALRDRVDLGHKVINVDVHGVQSLRALRAAGAEPTQPPAKWDVDIDRNWLADWNACQPVCLNARAGVRFKPVGGWVAGVTWDFCIKKPVVSEDAYMFHGALIHWCETARFDSNQQT